MLLPSTSSRVLIFSKIDPLTRIPPPPRLWSPPPTKTAEGAVRKGTSGGEADTGNKDGVFPESCARASSNVMASKIVRTTAVKAISPEEYIVFCLSPGKRSDLKGFDLKVVGNVDLRDGQNGMKVHTLRKAMIEGGVFADGTCALTTIEDCVVEGRCIVDKSRLSHVKQKFHAVCCALV